MRESGLHEGRPRTECPVRNECVADSTLAVDYQEPPPPPPPPPPEKPPPLNPLEPLDAGDDVSVPALVTAKPSIALENTA